MIILFVAALSAGLLLGVYFMLYGVERGAPVFSIPTQPRKFRFSLPAAGAALSVFGGVGYVLTTRLGVAPVSAVLVSSAVAAVGSVAALLAVRRWSREPSTELGDDPRFFLQGHPARVTSAAGEDGVAQIAYEVDGARHAIPARSTDASILLTGSDVVIEKIEDGVAWVEPWVQVEQRI
jgi:membrane protein implicated in regulation of membrane protease activity